MSKNNDRNYNNNNKHCSTASDRIMEKNGFNLQAQPVHHRRIPDLFSHNAIFSAVCSLNASCRVTMDYGKYAWVQKSNILYAPNHFFLPVSSLLSAVVRHISASYDGFINFSYPFHYL